MAGTFTSGGVPQEPKTALPGLDIIDGLLETADKSQSISTLSAANKDGQGIQAKVDLTASFSGVANGNIAANTEAKPNAVKKFAGKPNFLLLFFL